MVSRFLPFTAPRMEKKQMESEIKKLSDEEKERAYADLYGKPTETRKETKGYLDACLEEMETHLRALPENYQKDSYLRAMEQCPEYTTDPAFRLQFLRADYYDTKKAATRFIKYWSAKEYVFQDKAFHRLTLDDLDDDDLATLRNKAYLGLPKRDAAGRALMFSCRQKFVFKERRNILRLMFYLVNYLLESDESLQTTGFVVIVVEDGAFDLKKYDRKLDNLMLQYSNEAWPVRFVGFHYCFDIKLQELVLPFGMYMMGSALRARFRLHPGSRKRTRIQDLGEFGIAPDCLPVMMGGQLDMDIEAFLQERRKAEKEDSEAAAAAAKDTATTPAAAITSAAVEGADGEP